MDKNGIQKVYILGVGALGGIYAAKLFNLDPSLIHIVAGEKRAADLQQSGIIINEKVYHFDTVSPTDKQAADLIIIAVKNRHLQQAICDIKGLVGDNTIVISLLNGILSEEQIGNAIGIKHMLYAYGVGMDAERQGMHIKYTNPGRIVFGEAQNDILSDRVKAVKDLFERAQIPCQIPLDMQRALWSKFMLNTGINQASAILKAPYGMFQQNEDARRLMRTAAMEVVVLSAHCGIHLNQNDVDDFVKTINSLDPAGKTSMLQDIEAGRKTEVELFAGTVIELGKKYGIATPVNETILSIIRVMEQMQSSCAEP